MNERNFVRFVSLPGSDVQDLAIRQGGTVRDVLEAADFPCEGTVTVNAEEASWDTEVHDGDRIILSKQEIKNG